MKRTTTLIYQIIVSFFFISFVFGQLGSISIVPGIQVYMHDVALLFLWVVTGLMLLTNNQTLQISRFLLPLGAFIVVCFLSLFLQVSSVPSFELFRGFLYLFRFCAYVSIAVVVLQPFLSSHLWLSGLYGSGVALSILGILQVVFFPSLKSLTSLGWDEHYGRLFSTLFDPNFMGMVLVLTVVLGCYFTLTVIKGRVRYKNPTLFIVQLLVLISIILTFSRSTYIALVIALVIIAHSVRFYRALFLVAFLGIGIYMLVPKGSLDVNRLTRNVSTVARIENWQESIQLIQERPVFGFGFNLLRVRMAQNKQLDVNGIVSRDAGGVNSSILFVFVTTGMVGGLLYCWWLIKQGVIFASQHDRMLRVIGIASFLSIVGFSFFNQGLFYPWIMLWLFILTGVALRNM